MVDSVNVLILTIIRVITVYFSELQGFSADTEHKILHDESDQFSLSSISVDSRPQSLLLL